MAYDELIKFYTEEEAKQEARLAKSKTAATSELYDRLAATNVYGSGKLVRGYGAIESGYENALADLGSKYGLTIAQLKEQKQREQNAKWANLMKGGLTLVGAGVGFAAGNPMLGAEVGSILGSGISTAIGWETGASIPSEILQMASSIETPQEKANTKLRTDYMNSYIRYLDEQTNALTNPTQPAQNQPAVPTIEGTMNYDPFQSLFELNKIRTPLQPTAPRITQSILTRRINRQPVIVAQ